VPHHHEEYIMWNPPIALTPAEQKIAARTRKTRKFFVLLRARRHALLEATFQETLATASRPEPGGTTPVEAGVLALATLLQAYGPVDDRDAVALPVMAKRWQMVLDGRGAAQPSCSQGTLDNCRMRLIAHNLDKTVLERTGALAEQSGGFGARPLRAVLASPPCLAPAGSRPRGPGLAMRCGRRWAWRPRHWACPRRRSWRTLA
jgi:hypothetical protein